MLNTIGKDFSKWKFKLLGTKYLGFGKMLFVLLNFLQEFLFAGCRKDFPQSQC